MSKKEESIQNLILNYLKRNKNKKVIAIRIGYRTFYATGKSLSEKIAKIQELFKNENISKGDKIIIFGKNSIEWISVYFASILSGTIIIPLDLLTDHSLLKKIQKQVNAKAIFQDSNLVRLKPVKKFYLDNLDDSLRLLKNEAIYSENILDDDILEIIYTSGSTGDPKGVVLTNKNITSGLNSARSSVKLNFKLKILNLLPLSHILSQIYGLFLLMHSNNQIYFMDSIKSKKIISFIRNKKINGAILVPGILRALKKDLENKSFISNLGLQFRFFGVGGSFLDNELEKWFRRHLILVIQGYGLTETSSVLTTNTLFSQKVGSVGKIAKDVDVKISEDGEILVKGNNVTSCYYKDSEKTKDSFEGQWFKTGDLGYLKDNYIYLKGRKKDIIITGTGLNVYPSDIEKVLNKFPEVKESCVLEKNDKIHAVLILKKKTDLNKLVKGANSMLLAHQKISSYSLWHENNFPKTNTGKIKKFIVSEELEKIKARSYFYKEELHKIINNVLNPSNKIKENSKLSDLGMDSLRRIELISEIEDEFGIGLNEADINQYTKVSDLRKLMAKEKLEEIKFKKWQLNPLVRIFGNILRVIISYPLVFSFAKVSYEGLENLKDLKYPVIFASNHQSAWDPVVIIKSIKTRTAIPTHPMIFGIGVKKHKLKRKIRGFLASLAFNAYPFGEKIGTEKSLEFTAEGQMTEK